MCLKQKIIVFNTGLNILNVKFSIFLIQDFHRKIKMHFTFGELPPTKSPQEVLREFKSMLLIRKTID